MAIAKRGIATRGIARRGVAVRGIISRHGSRWAYRFDGVDDYGVLANRAIDVDQTIDIQWSQIGYNASRTLAQTIVAQCLSATLTSREFLLRVAANEAIELYVGGSSIVTGANLYSDGNWRIRLDGTSYTVWKNGIVVFSGAFSRGAAREPSAQTTIVARNNAGTFADFNGGLLYDLRINGTLWSIADRNQTIQPSIPGEYGPESVTQVIESLQSGWLYSGGNLIADNVAAFQPATSLRLNQTFAAGVQVLVEYELSISSGGVRAQLLGGTDQNLATRTTSGKYSQIVTTNTGNAFIGFQATANNTTCLIKNISVKPLGTANPLTLVNTTSAGWEEISV